MQAMLIHMRVEAPTKACLCTSSLYKRILREPGCWPHAAALMGHWACDWQAFSDSAANELVLALQLATNWADGAHLMRVAHRLLLVEDSLGCQQGQHRMIYLLGGKAAATAAACAAAAAATGAAHGQASWLSGTPVGAGQIGLLDLLQMLQQPCPQLVFGCVQALLEMAQDPKLPALRPWLLSQAVGPHWEWMAGFADRAVANTQGEEDWGVGAVSPAAAAAAAAANGAVVGVAPPAAPVASVVNAAGAGVGAGPGTGPPPPYMATVVADACAPGDLPTAAIAEGVPLPLAVGVPAALPVATGVVTAVAALPPPAGAAAALPPPPAAVPVRVRWHTRVRARVR
jgi:hypothetical protein